MNFYKFCSLFIFSTLIFSCKNTEYTIKGFQLIKIKNAQKNKPYLFHNIITLIDTNSQLNKAQKQAVENRLKVQLDDSSKVNKVDNLFFLGTIKNPVAYDTGYTRLSANTMRTSMYHLGYYNATDSFAQDTVKRRVTAKYFININKPTLIDTVTYNLKIEELNNISLSSQKNSFLQKNIAVTKVAIQSEVSRLVDSFNNNGYYKFTAAELRVLGDSTIAALTTISNDPFEQLQLLEEAQKKRDSPTLKLAIVLNKTDDSTKLIKYFINKIYVLSDYRPNDLLSDTITTATYITPNFIERYHYPKYKTHLFNKSITLKTGDVYKQQNYLSTLSNLTKLGVWQSINIKLVENLDKTDNVDIIIELVPAKKNIFSSSLDASYAAVSNAPNALGGSLFGFSFNLGYTNKNFIKRAIKMAHNVRFGIELNNSKRNAVTNPILTNDISYTNNTTIPDRFLANAFDKINLKYGESFVNTGLSYNNRINLFTLQSINLGFGVNANNAKGTNLIVKPLNVEFSLLNKTPAFEAIITANPFLKYSYNTTFILGPALSFIKTKPLIIHPKSIKNVRATRINFEESGFIPSLFGLLKKEAVNYIKVDAEIKKTITYTNKKELALRMFAGVGVPLRGDSSLPFFKQFFGGGSNSMRGWPVRGIGRGGQRLVPRLSNVFNDRTGDIQFESNVEFRHSIATFIPDLLKLKGAIILDIGNVWNIKAPANGSSIDLTKFQFKNAYRELGISTGYGLRLDFSNLIIRGDFSFRIKRPETSNVNNGWNVPSLTFKDVLPKIFTKSGRDWRYENFNFTLGINYPF